MLSGASRAMEQAAERQLAAKVGEDVGMRLHLQCMTFDTGLEAGS